MTKFLVIAVLAVIAWRMVTGLWPWQPSASSVERRAKARARELLGVGERATRQDILDAHKRLVTLVHPDRGGSNEDVHEANAARDILLGEHSHRLQEHS